MQRYVRPRRLQPHRPLEQLVAAQAAAERHAAPRRFEEGEY